MLSILIPTYNTKIVKLVDDLYSQCKNLNLDFEILCYDDGSSYVYKEFNRKITDYKRVVYKEMDKNHGRAKLRNFLANEAKYKKLLFLDADSGIIRDEFIFTYIKQMNKDVIYGGRLYFENKPEDINKVLHWKYGKEKESLKVETRNQNPYLNFLSNNFLIDKDVFERVKFDEKLSGYGYEDTLFAYELKKNNIKIRHIDNPVLHLELENASAFLQKTENAMKNLAGLYAQNKITDTRLIQTYKKLKKFGLTGIFKKIVFALKGPFKKNLYSSNPDLRFLQCYKLALFIKYLE
ncbi:MAG TPA: glycosyltransferase [Bacteroidetes bacterium]|nr:glycosyltransferase [Bacteroidota bacterium]